jgi:hypothetical protein
LGLFQLVSATPRLIRDRQIEDLRLVGMCQEPLPLAAKLALVPKKTLTL